MLVQEGSSRTLSIDLLLAAVLAFVAGGINSAGYIAFGYFSANMTGNVSLISDHLSLREPGIAIAFLAIVVLFVLGALCAALLIQYGKKRHLLNIYALTLLSEAVLIMAVGLAIWVIGDATSGIGVVGVLSFTMGIQNAASTTITDSRVRTTHLSGVATDIGVGLARLTSPTTDRPQTVERLKLHCTTVVSFLVGGVVGVYGFKVGGGAIFCVFSGILVVMCARYLRRSH